MDQTTRKLITIHKVLHPRDDIDRLYVSRKKKQEDSIDKTTRRLRKKEQRKTDYSDQKQHKEHKN